MADFVTPNPTVTHDGTWKDVTGGFAGLNVAIQNLSDTPMRIFIGPSAPSEIDDSGILLFPNNWPALFASIGSGSKIWAVGNGELHISETA